MAQRRVSEEILQPAIKRPKIWHEGVLRIGLNIILKEEDSLVSFGHRPQCF